MNKKDEKRSVHRQNDGFPLSSSIFVWDFPIEKKEKNHPSSDQGVAPFSELETTKYMGKRFIPDVPPMFATESLEGGMAQLGSTPREAALVIHAKDLGGWSTLTQEIDGNRWWLVVTLMVDLIQSRFTMAIKPINRL